MTKNDKMLNYLFYKIYRAALQGSLHDVPKSAAAITVAILININLLTLNIILAKLNIIDFLYSQKRVVIFIAIAIMVIMSIPPANHIFSISTASFSLAEKSNGSSIVK